MRTVRWRIEDLAKRQHGVVAIWQLQQMRLSKGQIQTGTRGLRRVHRGVCATGDLTELGWYMAAALALGPRAAISHSSALMLTDLRPFAAGDIHVSVEGHGGRERRDGVRIHRRLTLEIQRWRGVPVTSPSQSLQDADLPPHELYRAIEAAEKRGWSLTLPLGDVVRLKQAVRGYTRSDTEARFLLLLHDHGLPLPLVNHVRNGYEADFHWPDLRLVVEVDGFEHHRDKPNFDEDRHRGLVHEAAGDHVVRISADHVYGRQPLILRALRECGVRA